MEQDEFDTIMEEELKSKYTMPLDILKEWRDKEVVIEKNKLIVRGILKSFDLSTHIGIETKDGLVFLNGYDVSLIYLPTKE